MHAPVALLSLSLFAGALVADPGAGEQGKTKRKAHFTIGKETTYVTGPLDKDGYVDYAAALNERLGKGVTPETNANVLIWKAIGPRPHGGKPMPAEFFKLMGMKEPRETGEYFVELSRYLREQLQIEDFEAIGEIERQLPSVGQYPWAGADHPQIADWLKANEKPLNLVVEAARREHYFSPRVPKRTERGSSGLISAIMPGVQECRAITSALAARAMLRVEAKKYDEAWSDVLACHRLGRHLGRGGTLVEGLVGIAIESIAQRAALALFDRPELDARHLQGFLRDLRELPSPPQMVEHMEGGERFFSLDMFMVAAREGPQVILDGIAAAEGLAGLFSNKNEDGPPVPRAKTATGPVGDINWNPALRNANRVYDRLATAMREPTREKRESELDRIEKELTEARTRLGAAKELENVLRDAAMTPETRGQVVGDVLFGLFTPAVRKIQQAYDRLEQSRRNLRVAGALAAYQRDNKSYPKTLDVLATKYLDKLPDDLFTGKPLVYKPSGNGYLLYSLGPNGKDDEGRFLRDNPPGDDIAIRMPVPKPMK